MSRNFSSRTLFVSADTSRWIIPRSLLVRILVTSLLVVLLQRRFVVSNVIPHMTSLSENSDSNIDHNLTIPPHKIRHQNQRSHFDVNATLAIKKPYARNAPRIDDGRRYISAGNGALKLKVSRSTQNIKLAKDHICESCVVDVELIREVAPELLGLEKNYEMKQWLSDLESYYFEKAKSYICMHKNKTIYSLPVKERYKVENGTRGSTKKYTLNMAQRAECTWYAVHVDPVNDTETDELTLYNYQHPVNHIECRKEERQKMRNGSCTKYALDVHMRENDNHSLIKVRKVKKIGNKNSQLARWRQRPTTFLQHVIEDLMHPGNLSNVQNSGNNPRIPNDVGNEGSKSVRKSSPVLRTTTPKASRSGKKIQSQRRSPADSSTTRLKSSLSSRNIYNIPETQNNIGRPLRDKTNEDVENVN